MVTDVEEDRDPDHREEIVTEIGVKDHEVRTGTDEETGRLTEEDVESNGIIHYYH